MKPHEDVTLIDKSLFRKDLVVADTVYNPEKTKMILEAEEAGCQAIGGKGMLLYQGVVNYSLFTGKDFPIEDIRNSRQNRQNSSNYECQRGERKITSSGRMLISSTKLHLKFQRRKV